MLLAVPRAVAAQASPDRAAGVPGDGQGAEGRLPALPAVTQGRAHMGTINTPPPKEEETWFRLA